MLYLVCRSHAFSEVGLRISDVVRAVPSLLIADAEQLPGKGLFVLEMFEGSSER